MSKISEQKALESYPISKEKPSSFINQETFNSAKREGYIKGFNEAFIYFMEKTEMYLKTRVYYNMHPNNITTALQEFKDYIQDGN